MALVTWVKFLGEKLKVTIPLSNSFLYHNWVPVYVEGWRLLVNTSCKETWKCIIPQFRISSPFKFQRQTELCTPGVKWTSHKKYYADAGMSARNEQRQNNEKDRPNDSLRAQTLYRPLHCSEWPKTTENKVIKNPLVLVDSSDSNYCSNWIYFFGSSPERRLTRRTPPMI